MSTVVVLLDTSGLRAGPRPSEYETQQNQKTVKFSDVHGVDEVKEVGHSFPFLIFDTIFWPTGTQRLGRISQRPSDLRNAGRQTPQRCSPHRAPRNR